MKMKSMLSGITLALLCVLNSACTQLQSLPPQLTQTPSLSPSPTSTPTITLIPTPTPTATPQRITSDTVDFVELLAKSSQGLPVKEVLYSSDGNTLIVVVYTGIFFYNTDTWLE